MDPFVLILAIIVFSVFKNVIQEAKKKEGKKSLPDVFDTIAEHDESQDRALEALRRWEARQRAGSAPSPEAVGPEQPVPESMRIPRPGERRTDVRLKSPGRLKQEASRQQLSWRESGEASERSATTRRRLSTPKPQATDAAEQTRREAYDSIRQLLDGRTKLPVPIESEPQERRARRVPALPPETRLERRPQRAPVKRPRIQGTIAKQRAEKSSDLLAPSPARRSGRGGSGETLAGFERLEQRPPLERAVLYAELFGKPVGLRLPGEGIGD
ncbi:MAG: hypothetical protein M8865_11215 [marine benthic group bacterium]|nr:hypothetical protein [Gemmatimonadota bacterium]